MEQAAGFRLPATRTARPAATLAARLAHHHGCTAIPGGMVFLPSAKLPKTDRPTSYIDARRADLFPAFFGISEVFTSGCDDSAGVGRRERFGRPGGGVVTGTRRCAGALPAIGPAPAGAVPISGRERRPDRAGTGRVSRPGGRSGAGGWRLRRSAANCRPSSDRLAPHQPLAPHGLPAWYAHAVSWESRAEPRRSRRAWARGRSPARRLAVFNLSPRPPQPRVGRDPREQACDVSASDLPGTSHHFPGPCR